MTSGFPARVWMVAAPALLGPAIVFLLGPHTIFTTNADEFAVPFAELAIPWLLRTAALNWLIALGVGCLLALISERATQLYAAFLLALGLLLWGQGNLWNPDYGLLTGDDIDLAEHAWRAPYELAAWVVVLLLALAFFRYVSRIAPFAAIAFMAVQLIAAAIVTAQPEAAPRGRWTDPPPAIYQFSKTQNVIHLVLDAFQSDVFAEIVEEDRAAFDRHFDGFQYFIDHAGVFPTTSVSMVAMLTGEEYRNEKTAPDFARQAFQQSSIFEKVSGKGYDVDAISIIPRASLDEWVGPESKPNWNGARFQIRRPFVSRDEYREAASRELLELSLFRHAPHQAKTVIVNRPEAVYRTLWMDRRQSPAQARQYQASNSAAFFEHFIGTMTAQRSRPVYKLLHVGLPHRPVVLDRNCSFIGVSRVTRRSYREQARCAVKRVVEFLDRVRALGIYDSSLIVVSSDHGTGLRPSGFDGRSDSLPIGAGPSTQRLTTIAGTAKALMLVKPPHRTGPLVASAAPTSHVDLPPTILDLLGLQGDGVQGESMFRRDPAQSRSRSFAMYDLRQRFPKEFFTRLDVMAIDGPVTDGGRWHFERSIWRPDGRLESRDIDVGTPSSNSHLGPGWSVPQREQAGQSGNVTFVRALTRRAVLFASLPPGAAEIVLRAASGPESAPHFVSVEVDGRNLSRIMVQGDAAYRDLSIKIQAEQKRPTISQITLTFEPTDGNRFMFKLDRMLIRP
jgi:Sulfatase